MGRCRLLRRHRRRRGHRPDRFPLPRPRPGNRCRSRRSCRRLGRPRNLLLRAPIFTWNCRCTTPPSIRWGAIPHPACASHWPCRRTCTGWRRVGIPGRRRQDPGLGSRQRRPRRGRVGARRRRSDRLLALSSRLEKRVRDSASALANMGVVEGVGRDESPRSHLERLSVRAGRRDRDGPL